MSSNYVESWKGYNMYGVLFEEESCADEIGRESFKKKIIEIGFRA